MCRLLPIALVAAIAPSSARAIDFDTEIVPIFTKAGCNAGSCHGAAAGRSGFKLSLLGGDPAADYEAIVLERKGRRVNLVKPAESLILLKPTGDLPHEGGVRLEEGGAGEKRLFDWIAAGALRPKSPRKLTHLEVGPADFVADKIGAFVSLKAMARFDNGKLEDVTAWTVFTSSDPSAVELDATGAKATVHRRGRHVVIARFLDRVVPVRITVPIGEKPVDLTREPRRNFIDDEVYKTLSDLRIPVSPRIDAYTFLRRYALDLTGRLPSDNDIHNDRIITDPDRREYFIDSMLRSDAFVEYQTFRLASLFRIRPQPNDKEGAKAFHAWVREQVKSNAPFDQTARALLTATGDTHTIGPANFARLANDARGQAELVSSIFLGVRLQCANCHNHPLDRWTQDDYHGLAAVFSQLERGRVITVAGRGGVTNPRTGEPAVPRIPGDKYLDPADDHRAAFADWLTAENNPYFAKATVNRLWKQMFGRGLIDPTDDLRDTNPATHPELLDRLAKDFVDHGYDIRHTLRLIATSETYARSAESMKANKADDRYYSHAYRRPLEPEVLADAIADVTGVYDKYGDNPPGTRAIQLFNVTTPARSLDVLGRCSRSGSCEGEIATGGLPAKLHLLNGDVINRKIASQDGRLHKLIAANKTDTEIIAEFYLQAFGRHPADNERDAWLKRFAVEKSDRTAVLEDFVWSLLNCAEFTHNR